MGHDDAGQYEWVNVWAEAQRPKAVAPEAEAEPVTPATHKPAAAVFRRVTPAIPPEQLIRDFIEITSARGALASAPAAGPKSRTRAFTLVPSRTADAVPVLIGGVMALVLLAVFGAAAAMGKLAR
jgi:hypothetical protein